MTQDIFGRLGAHVGALRSRLADMQEQIFSSPPHTMEEFAKRLGAWEELRNEIKDLRAALSGGEDEESS